MPTRTVSLSLVRVAGIVAFGLVGSFELAVACFMAREIAGRVSGPIFTGWVNRSLDPATRATVLSMGGQVDALGQLTGGPLIGMVGQLAISHSEPCARQSDRDSRIIPDGHAKADFTFAFGKLCRRSPA